MPMPECTYTGVPVIEKPAVVVLAQPASLESVMDDKFNAELQYLLAMHRAAPQLHFLLAQIVGSLPREKDWLDPSIENFARLQLDLLQAIKPTTGELNV